MERHVGAYVPSERIATYRELVRLHTQLSDDIARRPLPKFTQVFADPSRPAALGLLKHYPRAQAMATAGLQAIATTLQELTASITCLSALVGSPAVMRPPLIHGCVRRGASPSL